MAHEIRYIAFNRREVEAMVCAYARARLGHSPAGSVVAVEQTESAIVVVFEAENQGRAPIRLGLGEAIACMLAFCHQRNDPAAQRFAKHVEVTGNSLVLVMSGPALTATGPIAC
ncbi:MAG: hypothetical protein AAFX81_16145 [Pseudomonadota bacterium]